MLDIHFIRENKDLVKEAARKKRIEFDADALIALDERRTQLTQEVEAKRAEQNRASDEISRNTENRDALIAKMQELKANMEVREEELKTVLNDWRNLMLQVPNVPDISVPDGESDADNKEIRAWGEKPEFNFTPLNHVELMEKNDLADFERGVKVHGFRGYYLKNEGALLSMAIWQFALDRISSHGYTPVIAPSLINKEAFFGTGFLPQSEEDLYKTQDANYLAGTAEVPMMGYYMGETLDLKKLPIKFVAFSPCFRREAGSHGKDTRGLIRVNEFFKVEQVILCEAGHEESVKLHEELITNSEKLLQELGLPYRVVVNCGGDLGLGQVKKYDIETWVPSEGKYRETHSASYFHDFQTRRLNIRYKDTEGKMHYAHSLNNTAFATPRLLVAILENYQQTDGSIKIPEVLISYVKREVIKRQ